MTRKLHIVPGIGDAANGMAVVARLIAEDQGDAVVVDLSRGISRVGDRGVEEVWVHGMWLPREWAVCSAALRRGVRLVRMPHGSLSPVYLTRQHHFRKMLVSPVERYFLRKADKVVATCDAEAGWIKAYEPRLENIEVLDLRRFFNLDRRGAALTHEQCAPLHILYLGRRHPLKGVDLLAEAMRRLQGIGHYEFRSVSDAVGEEKERAWEWCDVLVLPSLSENFGLVVAEALERGKRVIATDGAPAWGDGNTYGGRLTYLNGYRDGTRDSRILMLVDALESLLK